METNEKERDDVAAILARCPEKISNIEQLYGQAPQPTLFRRPEKPCILYVGCIRHF